MRGSGRREFLTDTGVEAIFLGVSGFILCSSVAAEALDAKAHRDRQRLYEQPKHLHSFRLRVNQVDLFPLCELDSEFAEVLCPPIVGGEMGPIRSVNTSVSGASTPWLIPFWVVALFALLYRTDVTGGERAAVLHAVIGRVIQDFETLCVQVAHSPTPKVSVMRCKHSHRIVR